MKEYKILPNSYAIKYGSKTVADIFVDELIIDGSFTYKEWGELKSQIDECLKKEFAESTESTEFTKSTDNKGL